MKYTKTSAGWLLLALSLMGLVSCSTPSAQNDQISDRNTPPSPAPNNSPQAIAANQRDCILVENGYGSQGQVAVNAQEVVSGLEVPWGIIFLSGGDMLVTERAGQVRLVLNGQLQSKPVATVAVSDQGEGGLLGIVAHPQFAENRLFYLYYTAQRNGSPVNRVERWQLSADGLSASPDKIILDNIPVARFHNGGRLRFGPDGMLYIGTGDARSPDTSQNVNSLAGKILRVTPDGQVPEDNPFPGNPVFITGIRNTQGFGWFDDKTLWVTDHGPSGDLGRTGHDEVSVARAGDNLGWPTIYGCQTQKGMVPPSITWRDAVPPGGAELYTGNAIPQWQGSLLIGALRAEHLQRITFDPQSPSQVQSHEVYLQGELGRIREVIMGPDGELYVTTSNCDGRGNCPPDKDKIYRITSTK
ncbi:MAG: PQQ-dependent sugar dehydrogenase [Cyanobacteriota bacterium]